MGQIWKDERETKHASQQASEIDPPSATSVWIDNSDLLFRDLLRGALAHMLAVARHRVLRGSLPAFSLGDQVVYAQFSRQHFEPNPAIGPDATESDKWLAEDLNPFEGLKCYRA
jgi:hypothetical protein